MKILFICSGNKIRSITAEKIFKSETFQTLSAGTSKNAIRVISLDDLVWADLIITMESKHEQKIRTSFPRVTKYKKIVNLNIKDNYKYMEPSLISLLKSKMDFINN